MENKPRFSSLSRSADFLTLKSEGKTLHVNGWLLVNYRTNDSKVIRCGWTIARQVGTAVVRNRLRRWGREYLRQWAAEVHSGMDMNLVFKRRERGFYSAMKHEELDEALDKLVSKIIRHS